MSDISWNSNDDDDADGQADAGELVASYAYDALHRRIERTIEGSPDVSYDDYYNTSWQRLEVRQDDDVDPLTQFVWGARYVDDLVLRDYDADTDGSGTRHYALHDAQFSITALIEADGDVVERYEYTPYGDRTVLDADFSADADGLSDYAFHVGHQGLAHDTETGLVYNRMRMFHPTLGRFMQRDPLGYVDGMNTVQYALSSPLALTDAFGLFGEDCYYTGDSSFYEKILTREGFTYPAYEIVVTLCQCKKRCEDYDLVCELSDAALDGIPGGPTVTIPVPTFGWQPDPSP